METETTYVGRCKAVGKMHGLSMFGRCHTDVDPHDGYFCRKHLLNAKRQVQAGQITWAELLRGKRRTKRTFDKSAGQEHLRDSSLNPLTNTHRDSVRCPGPAVLPPKSGGVAHKQVPGALEAEFTYEHKRFTDNELAELLVVGNTVKLAYAHPMADFTEIIKGTVMDLDFHGAVRVMDGSTGRNCFLARKHILSPRRRRVFLSDVPREPTSSKGTPS